MTESQSGGNQEIVLVTKYKVQNNHHTSELQLLRKILKD